MSDWTERRLHLIGIGGAGMSGLALVCTRLGAAVTGSDRAESSYLERLRSAGLEPRLGHDPEAVPEGAEVVVSTAIGEDNPELRRARSRGQRVLHRGELLAEVCAERRLIAVAGTHGKTTTAGMIIHLLRAEGARPSFLVGGELPLGRGGEATNAEWGGGQWIVAEADESDASFLELRPEVAVITNVELDHHARWSSRAELLDAFRRFAQPATGVAVVSEPDLDALARGEGTVQFAIAEREARGGKRGAPDLAATELRELPEGGISFRLQRAPAGPGDGWRVELCVSGHHNVLNALAAIAAVDLASAAPDSGLRPPAERDFLALRSFPGMARRLERKGTHNGAVIYDDYAHHPTEVSAVLAALRGLSPRRLIAVFQPHLYSRTKALAEQFGASLAAADEVAVLEVYPAREEPVGELAGVSGRQVAAAAAERARGRPVWWLPDAERARRALAPRIGPGDLLVTLGAGDIFRLADALVEQETAVHPR